MSLEPPPDLSVVSEPSATPIQPLEPSSFGISPLIRLTLLGLYVALTIPLPFLTQVTSAPVPASWLWIGITIGAIALYAALSERVVLDQDGIQVTYPRWVPRWLRPGWVLPWQEVQALKPRSTGQGGLVYYFLTHSGKAYLLPMRVSGFAKLVQQVQQKTGIDTSDVRPLAQPWMYLILLGLTLMLLAVDSWTIWTVWTQGYPSPLN
ncbi:hypothetical protein [Trichocoleus sp. FACHB-46]|uniref:hypothetical protein n=1 Tax=Trichocoleus TaxID=450526 RepID=UPI00351BAC5C